MHLDVVLLSRIQFALTIMFHYLFPPLTIGLGVFMVIIESLWIFTKKRIYRHMALFWTKLFAVNFALGVATGLVMEFEFGTNWATYSRFVGDVFGSALAAEGIFAFFLESGFLAILVFGWHRVSARMHYFATIMVASGSVFSSIWIVIANSWMQTPAGYHLVKTASGLYRAEITDFWALVFNPSSMYRLGHVLLAALILGAYFVLSIAAYYILRNKHVTFAKETFRVGLIYALVTSCGMLASGHVQADAVARNQPCKLAALEAHYKTGTGGTPMYLFGWPNSKEERVDFGVSIPCLLTFLVHQDLTTPVTGLDKFPPEDRPPILIPFITYHIMAGLGCWFIALSVLSTFLLWRGKLFDNRLLMWAFVFTVLGAYTANETGWAAAEVGRQPWIVYGLLRTKDAVSQAVPATHVLASIIMFGIIYAFLFAVWVHVMNTKIQTGPEGIHDQEEKLEASSAPPGEGEASFWAEAGDLKRKGEYSLTQTVKSVPEAGGERARKQTREGD